MQRRPLIIPPADLRDVAQWVAWKYYQRKPGAKPTKMPRAALTGKVASSVDPATWTSYNAAHAAYLSSAYRFDGIGFVFTKGDPFVGVDLDNAITEDGELLPWAAKFLAALPSYAEISPSGRGVKVFCRGELPGDGLRVAGFGPDKTGGLELYAWGRFFAVTGSRYGTHASVNHCPKVTDVYTWLCNNRDKVEGCDGRRLPKTPPPKSAARPSLPADIDTADHESRCLAYLDHCPASISGQRGHDNFFRAACETIRFDLTDAQAWRVMRWWSENKSGGEPWSDREIAHKLASAEKSVGRERGKRLHEGRRFSHAPN